MMHTWTLEEKISRCEARGLIAPVFTPQERDLARALSEAWYFFFSAGGDAGPLPGRHPGPFGARAGHCSRARPA
jgi:hypothetical protein